MTRFARDQVFVVTGGASGIGRGIAKRLADDGARVRILDIDARTGRATAADLGPHVTFAKCDVSREVDVRRAVRDAARWGDKRLAGVVNNAGLAEPHVGPVAKLALATWQRFLDVNLTSAFLLTKHAAPYLESPTGAIVNISSTRALQSEPDTIPYAATKGGLVALTHALAVSMGPAVRVNCISPGWIQTSKTKLRRVDHEQHPVGRVGMPEDIASLCAWLLSTEAGFVTGANFVVDGGMTRKMIYA
jgi:NAD(P)-dependent dehydrogenase (short-subunit alcohol dehydrogenase family)